MIRFKTKQLISYSAIGVIVLAVFIVLASSLREKNSAQQTFHDDNKSSVVTNCSSVGIAFNTVKARLKELSSQSVPADRVTFIVQDIAGEASAQSVFSPFVDGEPGDRAVIAISELGLEEAIDTFLRDKTLQPVAQKTEDTAVSEFYCAARNITQEIGNLQDHLAVHFIVSNSDSAITTKVEYSANITEDDGRSYVWTMEPSGQATLKESLCSQASKDLSNLYPAAMKVCEN